MKILYEADGGHCEVVVVVVVVVVHVVVDWREWITCN